VQSKGRVPVLLINVTAPLLYMMASFRTSLWGLCASRCVRCEAVLVLKSENESECRVGFGGQRMIFDPLLKTLLNSRCTFAGTGVGARNGDPPKGSVIACAFNVGRCAGSLRCWR
jgi:hypothetical protein